MNRKLAFFFLTALYLVVGTSVHASKAWRLEFPERVSVEGLNVKIQDLAVGPVPAAQGQLIILGKGEPGSMITVDRKIVLRKLVEAGLAAGVVFAGSAQVQVEFKGSKLSSSELELALRHELNPLIPLAQVGAPASWIDLEMPETDVAVGNDLEIQVMRNNPLIPGRNHVRFKVISSSGHIILPVRVTLHQFGEIPSAAKSISREAPLTPELFNWEWLDLSEVKGQLVSSRDALLGSCAGRTLPSGDQLRLADLKAIPSVRAGDQVELQIQRNGLHVSVRAQARQAGCVGQTIPVRNELNGKLVNARVAGPGLVEWRQ